MKTLRWLIVFAFAAVVAYQLLSTLLKANAVVEGAPQITLVPALALLPLIAAPASARAVGVVKGATVAADKTKEGLSKS
jgi:alpha/beta superfamily hydrolase